MTNRLRSLAAAALTAAALTAAATPIASAQTSSSMSSTSLSSTLTDPGVLQGLTELSSAIASQPGAVTTGPQRRTLTVGGVTREYLVVPPAGYQPQGNYPVILAFGGWQQTAQGMRETAHLETSGAENAVVVYPSGVGDAWAGAPYATTTITEDVDFVRAIVSDVATNFGGDRDTVYAAGLSNGGGMAAVLACHAPSLIDGVASVAGAYYDPTVTGCETGAVPTLLMHGTSDDVVAYGGGTRHGAPYRGVESAFATLGTKNSCDMSRLTSTTRGNATTVVPANCAARTELVRVSGGGHGWFGQPSASQAVTQFFNSL